MMHVIHENINFHVHFTVTWNNPLSANMCQLRHMTSSKEASFFSQKSVKKSIQIDADSTEKINCQLD